jgi:membrane-associated phospholipid phosphatase
MKRLFILLAAIFGLSAWSAALPALSNAVVAAVPTQTPSTVRTADPVVQWNRILLGIQATPGDQPATVHPTYELAIVHAAIYDAVVSIDHSAKPYLIRFKAPRKASRRAAADAAARGTLVTLYPSLQPAIDQNYSAMLAQIPAGARKSQGIHVGQAVAKELLARRADDGSSAPLVSFTPGTNPGNYQLTPPKFQTPVFIQWSKVKPFTLKRANQFRPKAPPALTSPAYATAVNEVKTLGIANGSTRTPDQSQIANFWNPPIWAPWNQIAETASESASLGHHSTLSQNARAFALLNLSFADSVIAFYDAKYTYDLWRPVTAIQKADTDGNPATAAEPNWMPLVPTAPDPSYPGAHSTISTAGAVVLSSVYGNRFRFTVSSSALPGIQRSFKAFSDAAQEAGLSRIYAGVHTRLDHVAGQRLGRSVATLVVDHFLKSQAASAHR